MTSQGTAPDPEGSGASSRPDAPDLDVLRAARLEALGERGFNMGGRYWALVPEVPFEFAEAWATRQRRRCAFLLLENTADVDEFMALRPSNEDFHAILDLYGTTPGKSSASS